MMAYLLPPDDILAEELGDIGLLGAADKQRAEGWPYRETTALRMLAGKIEAGGHADRKRLADEIAALFDDVEDVDVAVAGSSGAAERAASTMADDAQSSIMQLDVLGTDESGIAYPAATATVAEEACVVLFSWSATFGPSDSVMSCYHNDYE
ncbi:MAG: hypothetical protein V5A27_02715 [Halapricum sp.]